MLQCARLNLCVSIVFVSCFADSVALAKRLSQLDGQTMCNFNQQQCLASTSSADCSNNFACSWCASSGACLPTLSCFSSQLMAMTPTYCPDQSCLLEADNTCRRNYTTAASCVLRDECQWCSGVCVSNPPELCTSAVGSIVTVQGADQCPVTFTRQVTPLQNCTALQSLCLFSTSEDMCSPQPECDWCPGTGGCQPKQVCRFALSSLLYGGGCGNNQCPFAGPPHCLKYESAETCAGSQQSSGIPCQWCAGSSRQQQVCVYAPSTACKQTFRDGRSAEWSAELTCQEQLSQFKDPCLSGLETELQTRAAAVAYLTQRALLTVNATNTSLHYQPTFATWGNSVTESIPCLPEQQEMDLDNTLSIRLVQADPSMPTPAVRARWQLGRRTVHTTTAAWYCQTVNETLAPRTLASLLSPSTNTLLWQYAVTLPREKPAHPVADKNHPK